MKFFAYAVLILGVAGLRLHSQSAVLEHTQSKATLADTMMADLSSSVTSALKLKAKSPGEDLLKKEIEKAL